MAVLFTVFRIVFLIFFTATLTAYFLKSVKLFLLFFSLLVLTLGFSSINKSIELGLDTLRGRFYFIMGLGFIVVSIGEFIRFSEGSMVIYSWILGISRIIISFSIGIVTFAVIRFMNVKKWLILGFIVLIAFLLTKDLFFKAINTPNLLVLSIFSPLLVIFATTNTLAYWGSDMGRRWILGALASYTVIFGDIFFAKDILISMEHFHWHNIFWVFGYTFVAIASLIKE